MYLSLFFVASFSGETLRGDAAADVANKTVSSENFTVPPAKVEVVLPPKCLVIYRQTFSMFITNKPGETFCFLNILTTRAKIR